jgi:hypothetical protein
MYWLDTMKRLSFKFYQMGNSQMSQINYDAMSDAQLKQYFLKHRGDRSALQAYLDRINQRPLRIIASPNDPDFDEKVRAAILEQLETAKNKTRSQE